MKILVAQMQNQDPLNPAEPDQFLAQLAQMTQVEQLQSVVSSLDNMNARLSFNSLSNWAGTIGKKMEVDSNVLSEGDKLQITPEGAGYTSVLLQMKNQNTGNVSETVFLPGQELSYTNESSDPVEVVAIVVQTANGTMASTTSALRTISSVSMNNGTVSLSTQNGDTYTTEKVRKIL